MCGDVLYTLHEEHAYDAHTHSTHCVPFPYPPLSVGISGSPLIRPKSIASPGCELDSSAKTRPCSCCSTACASSAGSSTGVVPDEAAGSTGGKPSITGLLTLQPDGKGDITPRSVLPASGAAAAGASACGGGADVSTVVPSIMRAEQYSKSAGWLAM